MLGALVIPRGHHAPALDRARAGARSRSSTTPRTRSRRASCEDTIKSQVQDANAALTRRIADVALEFLGLIVTGGEYSFLGRRLRRARARGVGADPARGARDAAAGLAGARAEIDRVIEFSRAGAREPRPLRRRARHGGHADPGEGDRARRASRTSLSSFAVAIAATVSLMFITLLLAAGTLALEREENAFPRLVRGLVSRTGLLLEKAGAGGGLLARRLPADAGRAGAVRGARLGPASRSGRWRSPPARWRSPRWAWPSAR